MSRTLRSIAPVLVLLVAFSAGTAHALPLPGRIASSQPASLFATAWDWLTGLLVSDAGQVAAPESRDKAGWEMDPNGLLAPIASYSLTPPDDGVGAVEADPDL